MVQSLRRLRPERLADRSAREGVAEVPFDEDLTGGGEDEEGLYHYGRQREGDDGGVALALPLQYPSPEPVSDPNGRLSDQSTGRGSDDDTVGASL